MHTGVRSAHLSELLARLYAAHRRDVAAWMALTDEQREEVASRSNAKSFFGRDAWDVAAAEVGQRSDISKSRLAKFGGGVKRGTLQRVEDVALAVAKLHDCGFVPTLLDILRVTHPAVVDRLGLAVDTPAMATAALHKHPAATQQQIEGAGFKAATMTMEQICDLLGLTDGDFRRLITRGAILAQSRQAFAFNRDLLSLLDRTPIEGKLRERKPG